MIQFVPTEDFKRSFKSLCKKYKSLRDDFEKLTVSLSENPNQGVDLGCNFRKIRLSIKSKGKGKRGGARVITFNQIIAEENGFIVLVDIYDKSEIQNMTLDQIRKAYQSLDK